MLPTLRLAPTALGLLAAASLAAAPAAVRDVDDTPALHASGAVVVEGRVSGDSRVKPVKVGRRVRMHPSAAARRAATARKAARKGSSTARARALRTPNDPLWSGDWSLHKVNAPGAWSYGTGSGATVVAVVDTGVDGSHPDLAGALVPGWDFVGDDADASDDHGHGTAVAGVIAARSDNGVGVASACWTCSIMPVKVVGANGVGTSEDIAAGIAWAADHGAHVINVSLVVTADDPAVAQAVAHARSRGAMVVAAAGNAGGEGVTYPAAYPGVLGVAGADAADAAYGWSTRGGWVTLAAPGCNLTTTLGGGFGEFCGTSSAAAALSGVAALARSLPGATAENVAAALGAGAVRVPYVAAGRVDARATLLRLAVGGRAA